MIWGRISSNWVFECLVMLLPLAKLVAIGLCKKFALSMYRAMKDLAVDFHHLLQVLVSYPESHQLLGFSHI